MNVTEQNPGNPMQESQNGSETRSESQVTRNRRTAMHLVQKR